MSRNEPLNLNPRPQTLNAQPQMLNPHRMRHQVRTMKEANKAAAGTHSKEELDGAVAKLKVLLLTFRV